MKLEIGKHSFGVNLEEAATTKAIVELLPMSVTMRELNGNEKYYYLNKSLPSNPQKVKQINVGDIMLWGNDCLVIFYKSFATPYSYTKIGCITNPANLQTAVGEKDVVVKWINN